MSLPDLPRADLSLPARALAASAVALGRRLTWRTLHPADRERFVECPRPAPLVRVPYEAADGARGTLFYVPPAAGGAGEPVVVAHALALGPDAYRYGAGATLVDTLRGRGFAVYLLTHRGDRAARVPRGARLDFDAILEGDVPAAIDAACRHASYERVHWVGHGLGGQLGLVAAARREALATVTAIAAPVDLPRPRSEVRALTLLSRLLPDGVPLPAHVVARLATPMLGTEEWMGQASGQRVRGVMEYGTDRCAAGLVDQIADWVREGGLTSRGGLVDYRACFADARVPLLVMFGSQARIADRRATEGAVRRWGADDASALEVPGRTADVLFGPHASERSFTPMLAWLEARRRLAWEEQVRIARTA